MQTSAITHLTSPQNCYPKRWPTLPVDLAFLIFAYLGRGDFLCAAATSHSWKKMADAYINHPSVLHKLNSIISQMLQRQDPARTEWRIAVLHAAMPTKFNQNKITLKKAIILHYQYSDLIQLDEDNKLFNFRQIPHFWAELVLSIAKK